MADRPIVKTQGLPRDILSKICQGDPRAITALENILNDVQNTLPDATQVSNQAVEEASTAAQAAQDAANGAMAAAQAAQSDIDDTQQVPVLLASISTLFPQGKTLSGSKAVSITSNPTNLTFDLTDQIQILAADVADSTGAFVSSSLSFALKANQTYELAGTIVFQSSATTTGIALGLNVGGGTAISGGFSHATGPSSIGGSYNTGSGTVKGVTSGVATANENVPITARWVLKTVADITVQMVFESGVATSGVTLKAGLSYLILRRIA